MSTLIMEAKELVQQSISFLDRSPEEIRRDIKRTRLTFENYSLLLDVEDVSGNEEVSFTQRKMINALRKVLSLFNIKPEEYIKKAEEKIRKEAEIGATEGVATQLSSFLTNALHKTISSIVICLVLLSALLGTRLVLSYGYYILYLVLFSFVCYNFGKDFFMKYIAFVPWAAFILSTLLYMKLEKKSIKEMTTLVIKRIKEHKSILIVLIGFTITSISAYILMSSNLYVKFLDDVRSRLHKSLKGGSNEAR
jgi:hypothetical protein